jgi:hypothetical protein
MVKRYKPKKAFKIKLDEMLVIDRTWYHIEISEKGVVRVWNAIADKYARVNERGYFKATPKQIESLKEKLIC